MKILSLRKTTEKTGFVLPTLMLVTMVLLILATTLLASGTTSLRVATHDQQSDQALYAAEAGLVRASAIFAAEGAISSPFEGDLGGSASSYSVVAYENTGETEMQVPNGPVIPPQTVYLRSEGISENGTRRVEGALFTIGLQAFKVGALGNKLNITNASFDAYNSAAGDYDPSAAQNDLPLLASNSSGGPTFTFDNATVNGDIFVGPGGDPTSQIAATNSTIGDATAMASSIDLEEIEVPEQPEGTGEEDEEPVSVSAVGALQMVEYTTDGTYRFSDGAGMDFTIDPEEVNTILDNPALNDPTWGYVDDLVPAINGTGVIHGDDPEGPYIQMQLDGHHWLMLRPDGRAWYQNEGAVAECADSISSLSHLLFRGFPPTGSAAPPANVTNPTVLTPGFYDTVTINEGWDTNLSDEGTYVIKNLVITGDAKLRLPELGRNATFYVTESLVVDGQDALVNETLKAPKMKVFYTGSNAVHLAGGSQSYFTLVAPDADITLDSVTPGIRTQFFGALVGDDVTVNNASFHFDTATNGIGTGTMGSAVTLIHRHRL